jgi:PhzF family phenazine biosynthesis protein
MSTPIYYVDAFTDNLFSGNPAAVIFSQLNDEKLMQKVAAENNLSETAFIREENGIYHIRWFAPLCEIDLCGHATLASAFVYFKYIQPESTKFEVQSLKNGILKVTKKDNLLTLDFPKDSISKYDDFYFIEKVINTKPAELFIGRNDVLAIVESEAMVRNLDINFEILKKSSVRGLIVSAKGESCDFVSRFFAPSAGVYEDPVTGSAHTTLIPYWSDKLNKTSLKAQQLSERGGVLFCEDKDDRVFIGGNAVEYLKGEINI